MDLIDDFVVSGEVEEVIENFRFHMEEDME